MARISQRVSECGRGVWRKSPVVPADTKEAPEVLAPLHVSLSPHIRPPRLRASRARPSVAAAPVRPQRLALKMFLKSARFFIRSVSAACFDDWQPCAFVARGSRLSGTFGHLDERERVRSTSCGCQTPIPARFCCWIKNNNQP
ncbi:hypothetical protein ROHU_008339 [Labeo rohita]|uniref:Uncharacterized protein n=1 Tax=Labeo rohita TaxID=84645 RepID=A0A498MAQ0_LABRO|nr:hypothetical protein ROHU_008339 [Labeo rohita]